MSMLMNNSGRLSTTICAARVRNEYLPDLFQVEAEYVRCAANGVTVLDCTSERHPAHAGVTMDEAREIERDLRAAYEKGWR